MTAKKRAKARATAWKTCSRGHKFRGPGACPVCWPGGQERERGKLQASKRSEPLVARGVPERSERTVRATKIERLGT